MLAGPFLLCQAARYTGSYQVSDPVHRLRRVLGVPIPLTMVPLPLSFLLGSVVAGGDLSGQRPMFGGDCLVAWVRWGWKKHRR